MPTPMIEPTMVCELEAGKPKYHVPRFQIIAAMSRANTIAKPDPASDLKDQLDRQQRNHAESHRAGGGQNSEGNSRIPTRPPRYAAQENAYR